MDPIVPSTAIIISIAPTLTLAVPATIAQAGTTVAERFLEFFAANIRNPNTRIAYARAVRDFFRWTEQLGLTLSAIRPLHVAAYIEHFVGSAPTIKQNLAAIRMLFNWLVTGGMLAANPTAAVRGPKHVVKVGKTPVVQTEEARALLQSIPVNTIASLRDRALIAVMVYSFARVGAVVSMAVEDYYQQGRRCWFRLHEKGGKYHQVPAHHKAEEYVDAYLEAAAVQPCDKRLPLFRSINSKRKLTTRRIDKREVWEMIKRRARAAGLPPEICCHTFRATGITSYLENGGTIEKLSRLRRTSRRRQPSFTTAPPTTSRSTRLRRLEFEESKRNGSAWMPSPSVPLLLAFVIAECRVASYAYCGATIFFRHYPPPERLHRQVTPERCSEISIGPRGYIAR